jgi:hypothetical protein
MKWLHHVEMLLHENLFHINYRMSIASFNQLLQLLSPTLPLKEKYAIRNGHGVPRMVEVPLLQAGFKNISYSRVMDGVLGCWTAIS